MTSEERASSASNSRLLPRSNAHNVPNYGAAEAQPPRNVRKEDTSFVHVLLPCTAMWCVTFIGSLDTTIVAMLLGTISSSFLAAERASWIGSTFLLSVCCTAPLYGRLSDIFGRKRSLLLAVSVFLIGTLLCGLARSMNQFLIARTLAGLGGGGLNTLNSVIMSSLVPLKSRGVYQGLSNIVYGLGVGTGAPLGGLLNDKIGWRGAFYVQIPFLLVALLALSCFLEHDEGIHFGPGDSIWRRLKDVDILGLALFACVPISFLLAFDLVSVQNAPLSDMYVMTAIFIALIAFVLFLAVERTLPRFPLLSFSILSIRSVWSTASANFFISMALISFNYFFPFFFQTVAQMPASDVGLRMMPASFAIGVGSLAAGFYMRHYGRYYGYLCVSVVVLCLSCLPMAFYSSNPPKLLPFVFNVPLTFSQAGFFTCALVALVHVVGQESLGVATGMNYLFRSTGQVMGISLSGFLLQWTLSDELGKRILGPGSDELILQIRHDSTILPSLPADLRHEALLSYTSALHNVFLFIIGCYVCTMILSFFVENKHLDEPFSDEQDTT